MIMRWNLSSPPGVRLAPARYDAIERIAADVLTICNPGIPVDPFAIAERMGIIVISYSDVAQGDIAKFNILLKESYHSFKFEANNRTIIYYNDRQDEATIRNSTMHEIGHFVLDHKEETDVTEAEAKYFAKYVCAPTWLAKICSDNGYEIDKVFGIGEEAYNILHRRISKIKPWYKPKDYENDLEKWFYDNTGIGLQIISHKMQGYYGNRQVYNPLRW